MCIESIFVDSSHKLRCLVLAQCEMGCYDSEYYEGASEASCCNGHHYLLPRFVGHFTTQYTLLLVCSTMQSIKLPQNGMSGHVVVCCVT